MGIETEALAVALNDREIDLEWLLLLEMSETIEKIGAMAGVDPRSVVFGDGVEIRLEDRDPREGLMDRLEALLGAVRAVVNASDVDPEEVCRAILKVDGWSWTPRKLRGPLWMWEHEEVGRREIAEQFKELEWLGTSMSEIL